MSVMNTCGLWRISERLQRRKRELGKTSINYFSGPHKTIHMWAFTDMFRLIAMFNIYCRLTLCQTALYYDHLVEQLNQICQTKEIQTLLELWHMKTVHGKATSSFGIRVEKKTCFLQLERWNQQAESYKMFMFSSCPISFNLATRLCVFVCVCVHWQCWRPCHAKQTTCGKFM